MPSSNLFNGFNSALPFNFRSSPPCGRIRYGTKQMRGVANRLPLVGSRVGAHGEIIDRSHVCLWP